METVDIQARARLSQATMYYALELDLNKGPEYQNAGQDTMEITDTRKKISNLTRHSGLVSLCKMQFEHEQSA